MDRRKASSGRETGFPTSTQTYTRLAFLPGRALPRFDVPFTTGADADSAAPTAESLFGPPGPRLTIGSTLPTASDAVSETVSAMPVLGRPLPRFTLDPEPFVVTSVDSSAAAAARLALRPPPLFDAREAVLETPEGLSGPPVFFCRPLPLDVPTSGGGGRDGTGRAAARPGPLRAGFGGA